MNLFLLISLIILCVLNAIFSFLLWQKTSKPAEEQKMGNGADGGKILSAREDGSQIIAEANQTAGQIINEAKVFASNLREKVASDVGGASEAQKRLLKTISDKFSQEGEASLVRASDEFGSQAKLRMDGLFSKLEARLASAVSGAQEEIKTYKERRMKEVDQEVLQTTKKVIKEVLPEGLTLEDHEKLVMEALVRAKK